MANAKPVDLETAREVGMKFVNANAKVPLRGAQDLQFVTTYHIERGDAAFHIFNTPNGFVIVAADDCATPILGYSNEGQFDLDNIPIQLQENLQHYVEQIEYGIGNHVENETIAERWTRIRTTGRLTNNRSDAVVGPLVTALWDQGCYYNAMCPENVGPCGHAYVGCTAVAMGMVMHYWRYPIQGSDSHSYIDNHNNLYHRVNYGATTYDWDHMPNELTNNSTQEEIDAVSTLLYHVGVAAESNYDEDETPGAIWTLLGGGVHGALQGGTIQTCFGYSDVRAESKADFDDETWLNMMKTNLNDVGPILVSGRNNQNIAHGYVCDGYDSDDLFHLNYGWGGMGNGYYSLDAIPLYNDDFTAWFEIRPSCEDGSYQITVSSSSSDAGTVYGSGTFDCGTSCTLVAEPNEGYIFDHWTKDGQVVSCVSPYSAIVTENADYVAHFEPIPEGVLIGDATYGNGALPLAANQYSMTQQIYTADELNMETCEISSISFYYNQEAITHNLAIYLVNTEKTVFENESDWINVTEADLVFSGEVRLSAGARWNTITFGKPFNYDGSSNLALIVNDSTGHVAFSGYGRTFNCEGVQAIAAIDYRNPFDPTSPSNYIGVLVPNEKNQIIFGVLNDDCIMIGEENIGTHQYIPSCSGSLYTLSEQIYTTEELGSAGFITSIAFFNAGRYGYTRNYDMYLAHTEKNVFNNDTDWIAVTEADKVFSGNVTMIANDWTTITLDATFIYNGTSNLALIMDDNTGYSSSGMACRVFNAQGNQAISVNGGVTNYDPCVPLDYSGTLYSEKNQILVTKMAAPDGPFNITVTASPVQGGTVSGGGEFSFGESCTVTATPADGFVFTNWTVNGNVVSTTASYTFYVGSDMNLVANFDVGFTITVVSANTEQGSVSGGGVFASGQTCTVTAMPADGYRFIHWTIGGDVVSTDASYSFIVSNDMSLVAHFAEGMIIGDGGDATSSYLPTYCYYNYSLTQQIYTAEELGVSGIITSIAFFNGGTEKTRTYDLYLKSTTKSAFTSGSDWESVTEADKVFSGSVTMTANEWTFIVFDNPFIYDSSSNVVLVVDDNTRTYSFGFQCRVFDASSQALRIHSDGTNYNPFATTSYSGTIENVKNQIIITKEPLSGCMRPTQLTATEVGPRYVKLSWTENGEATEWIVVCNGNLVQATTNEDFVLDGLDPETQYTISVYPVCDENKVSAAITITTLEACPVPQNLVVSHVTGNTATVTWNGYADSYNVQLGIPVFLISQNFNNIIPADWSNDATYPWTVVDGHIQSGNVGVGSSTSSISFTTIYPIDGTISFDFWSRGEGSDSNNWDKSRFYIDDELMFDYGQHTGWESYSTTVSAGEHTFTWTYKKDSSVNPDGDCFIVDNVEMKAGETSWNEPIAVADAAYRFTGLTPETIYCVKVQGVCDDGLTENSEVVLFTTSELTTITQTIELVEGWNWVSTYIEMDPVDMLEAVEASLGEDGVQIKSKTLVTAWDEEEEEWGGGLQSIGLTNGNTYMIQASASCTVTLQGPPSVPTDYTITLYPKFWTWIGFPCGVEVDIEDAFAGFEPLDGDQFKSKSKVSSWDDGEEEWTGGVLKLIPGTGYMFYSNGNEVRTLTFQTGAK
jgi:hypothetical protein